MPDVEPRSKKATWGKIHNNFTGEIDIIEGIKGV